MLRSLAFHVFCVVALCCAAAVAQQPDSQLPDAPQQQPQAQPPATPPPSDEQPKEEKKPESRVKRTLKRGAPNCMHVGGLEKCWPAPGEQENGETKGEEADGQPPSKVPNSQPLPRSSNPEESSSKDSQLPLNLPGGESSAPADVRELHPYDPHKADKNVEIGDFYFKRYNYRAAESRYAEALDYMPNHALATFKLAEAQEKLGKSALARAHYERYLKILPGGELAGAARKALARLDAQAKESPPTSPPVQKRP